jgi:hypothetical protein
VPSPVNCEVKSSKPMPHSPVSIPAMQTAVNLPSKPFSAGQYWICFEMVAEDDSLVIASVRLPRHPDVPATVREEDEAYSIACEVATMEFVRQRLSEISVPCLYTYEGPGSQLAADAGAAYMLLEGFYGNTLQDVAFDTCSLSVSLMLLPDSVSFFIISSAQYCSSATTRKKIH